jgi:hypothetical protein
MRFESQYLAFEMAESVQGWRQKWFYIKDQKSSETDEYGLAPFDADKGLAKLTSWDALPSDAEADEIKLLLARIQDLKNAAEKELNGTQLIVFFLQWRIPPLQAKVSKLWTYSGLSDPSRVSKKDPEVKDLKKRVRSLTTLTAKKVVPTCLAVPFDSTHPLPKVLNLQPDEILCFSCNPGYLSLILCVCLVIGPSYPGFMSSTSKNPPTSLFDFLEADS